MSRLVLHGAVRCCTVPHGAAPLHHAHVPPSAARPCTDTVAFAVTVTVDVTVAVTVTTWISSTPRLLGCTLERVAQHEPLPPRRAQDRVIRPYVHPGLLQLHAHAHTHTHTQSNLHTPPPRATSRALGSSIVARLHTHTCPHLHTAPQVMQKAYPSLHIASYEGEYERLPAGAAAMLLRYNLTVDVAMRLSASLAVSGEDARAVTRLVLIDNMTGEER
eukprot:16157-Chlamydomonas_euryale.AAC.1